MFVAVTAVAEKGWPFFRVCELEERAARAEVELRATVVQQAQALEVGGERWPLVAAFVESLEGEL